MIRPASQRGRIVGPAAAWLLSAGLVVVLLRIVVAPLYGPFRYDRSDALVVALLALLALSALSFGVQRATEPLERHPWVRRALVLACFVALAVTQLVVGRAMRVPPGFDAGTVNSIAAAMATDQPVPPEWLLYLDAYPNNHLLVAILQYWFDLALWSGENDFLWSAVVLNVLAMTIAVLLTYLTARRMGAPGAAYLVLAVSGVFVAMSPWVAVAYSDTLAMPFTAAVLYLFSLERHVVRPLGRCALWGTLAFVATIGYHVKPTAIFVAVAAVLVACAASRRPSRRRAVTALACAGALAAGSLVAGSTASYVTGRLGMSVTEDAAPLRLNVTHFLKMGAQAQPGPHNDYYGSYYEPDIFETRALDLGSERLWRNAELYAERVADMGPVGYAAFLFHKASWFMGDGSFLMWGEGGMVTDPMQWPSADARSQAIREWFFIGGDHYSSLFSLWQGTWLALLLLMSVTPLLRRQPVLGPTATVARVSLLLLVTFLLLFEARARYLILYLPMFMMLGALSLDGLAARAAAWVRRSRPAP